MRIGIGVGRGRNHTNGGKNPGKEGFPGITQEKRKNLKKAKKMNQRKLLVVGLDVGPDCQPEQDKN